MELIKTAHALYRDNGPLSGPLKNLLRGKGRT